MEIKPLAGLTTWVCRFVELGIAGAIALICAEFYHYRHHVLLETETDADAGLILPHEILRWTAYGFIALAIVKIVLFFMWTYRVNKNLRGLSHAPMIFTPGWSVGWFFIPVACVWKPYQVLREIWRVSHRSPMATPNLLGTLWFLWLFTHVMDRLEHKFIPRSGTLDEVETSLIFSVANDVFYLVFSLVMLLFVKRVAAAYETNFIEPCASVPSGGPVTHPPPLPRQP